MKASKNVLILMPVLLILIIGVTILSIKSGLIVYVNHKSWKIDEGSGEIFHVLMVLHDPPGDHSVQNLTVDGYYGLKARWNVVSESPIDVKFIFSGVNEERSSFGFRGTFSGGYELTGSVITWFKMPSSMFSDDPRYIGPSRAYNGELRSGGSVDMIELTIDYEVWYSVKWRDNNFNGRLDKSEKVLEEKNIVVYSISKAVFISCGVLEPKYESIISNFDAEQLQGYGNHIATINYEGGSPLDLTYLAEEYLGNPWVSPWLRSGGSINFKIMSQNGESSATAFLEQQVSLNTSYSVSLVVYDDEFSDFIHFDLYLDPFFPTFMFRVDSENSVLSEPDEGY